jgi:ATP-binding protein involved in chromosome partitioning
MQLPGIKKIILVASGKGGVGKSTVAANLALSLERQGLQVGLLDADIYGPSIPRIFEINLQAKIIDNKFIPFVRFNVRIMSVGFLVKEETTLIWRGPMIVKALHRLFTGTQWAEPKKELDYLIVDTPPGTGDIHLSILKNYTVAGAVVVSTPQTLSVIDSLKTVTMLQKLNIAVVGIVENMALITDNQGGYNKLFGESKLVDFCREEDIPHMGYLPFSTNVAARYFFPNDCCIMSKVAQEVSRY